MRAILFFIGLIFCTTQALADQKWATHEDSGKLGQRRDAKVPPSHKIPVSLPYVEGCGYNTDGSIFVSAGPLVKKINREGKEITTTKMDPTVQWSSSNFKTFLTKSEAGEFKLLTDGKETTLSKNAFTGVAEYPVIQISPKGNTILASLEKKDGDEVPWSDRKEYYGVFSTDGKQIRALTLPLGARVGVFSPDGKKVLGSLINPPRLFLVDIESGDTTYLTALDESLHSDILKQGTRGPYGNDFWRLAAFSSDGKRIALSTNRLLVFDLQKQGLSYEERNVYTGYERAPQYLGFTPDDKTLIYSVKDFNTDIRRIELRRLDASPQKVTLDIPLPRDAFSCTAFDSESDKLLVIEGAKDRDSRKNIFWAREFQLADLFSPK